MNATPASRGIEHIRDYHAHVYFDERSMATARALCETAAAELGVKMGRVHRGPVGPHPCGSCQLAFPVDRFAAVVPWLAVNRGELTVFVHANTGDDWRDHTAHVIWLGESVPLNIEIFLPRE